MSLDNFDLGHNSSGDGEDFLNSSSDNFLGEDLHVPIGEGSSEEIKNKDSNFIFFFGTADSGKSVILSSMLYYLSSQVGVLLPRLESPNSKEAQVLLSDFFENIRQGILPNRTQRDQVTRLDLVFQPNNKSEKVRPINLTFLETSGENHNEIRRGGSYHSSIEDYLNAKIPLTFIIVTSYDTAHRDDTIINDFLDELVRKKHSIKSIKIILVISKWDKSGKMSVTNSNDLDDFVRDRLSRTSQRMDTYGYPKTYFTIGRLQVGQLGERITMLNLSSAERLSKWLYKSITDYPLDYEGTFWERIKSMF